MSVTAALVKELREKSQPGHAQALGLVERTG